MNNPFVLPRNVDEIREPLSSRLREPIYFGSRGADFESRVERGWSLDFSDQSFEPFDVIPPNILFCINHL